MAWVTVPCRRAWRWLTQSVIISDKRHSRQRCFTESPPGSTATGPGIRESKAKGFLWRWVEERMWWRCLDRTGRTWWCCWFSKVVSCCREVLWHEVAWHEFSWGWFPPWVFVRLRTLAEQGMELSLAFGRPRNQRIIDIINVATRGGVAWC